MNATTTIPMVGAFYKITPDQAEHLDWDVLARRVAAKVRKMGMTPFPVMDALMRHCLSIMLGRHELTYADLAAIELVFLSSGDARLKPAALKKAVVKGMNVAGLGHTDGDEHGPDVEPWVASVDMPIDGQTPIEEEAQFGINLAESFQYHLITTYGEEAMVKIREGYERLAELRKYAGIMDQHRMAMDHGLSNTLKALTFAAHWHIYVEDDGDWQEAGRPAHWDGMRCREVPYADKWSNHTHVVRRTLQDFYHIQTAMVWGHLTGEIDEANLRQIAENLYLAYLVENGRMKWPVLHIPGQTIACFEDAIGARYRSPGEDLFWNIQSMDHLRPKARWGLWRVKLFERRKRWVAQAAKRWNGKRITLQGLMEVIFHAEAFEVTNRVHLLLGRHSFFAEFFWCLDNWRLDTPEGYAADLSALEAAHEKAAAALVHAARDLDESVSTLSKDAPKIKGKVKSRLSRKQLKDLERASTLLWAETPSNKKGKGASRKRKQADLLKKRQENLHEAKVEVYWAKAKLRWFKRQMKMSGQVINAFTDGQPMTVRDAEGVERVMSPLEQAREEEQYCDRSPKSPFNWYGALRALYRMMKAVYEGGLQLPYDGLDFSKEAIVGIIFRMYAALDHRSELHSIAKQELGRLIGDSETRALRPLTEMDGGPSLFVVRETHCGYLESKARSHGDVAATLIGSAVRPGRWSVSHSNRWITDEQAHQANWYLSGAWRLMERIIRRMPAEDGLLVRDAEGNFQRAGIMVVDAEAFVNDPVFPAENGNGHIHHPLVGGSLRHDKPAEQRSELSLEDDLVPLTSLCYGTQFLADQDLANAILNQLVDQLLLVTPAVNDETVDWDGAMAAARVVVNTLELQVRSAEKRELAPLE